MPVDKFGRMSDSKTRDTGVSLTYINNNYIRSDGGTPVTGSIDMGGNSLRNVAEPVNPHDVATKEYTDNKRTHVVMVNSVYEGPLKKGAYQFSFGSENPNSQKGFLIPHSGRIVKIRVRTPINRTTLEILSAFEDKARISDFSSSLFTIEIHKRDEADSRKIGHINCKDLYNPDVAHPLFKKRYAYDLCLDESFFISRPELKGGDVINVRTELDLDIPPIDDYAKEHPHTDKSLFDFLVTFPFPGSTNLFFISFLIELDPL